MPKSVRALSLLVEAYAAYVQEHGPERAETIARAVFVPAAAQRVLARYAEQLAPREVIVDFDADEITCPYCSAVDSIVEIDQCVRRNETEVSGGGIGISTQEAHFDHVRFECDACGRHVALPDGVEPSHV